jgi:hypothetical protein
MGKKLMTTCLISQLHLTWEPGEPAQHPWESKEQKKTRHLRVTAVNTSVSLICGRGRSNATRSVQLVTLHDTMTGVGISPYKGVPLHGVPTRSKASPSPLQNPFQTSNI